MLLRDTVKEIKVSGLRASRTVPPNTKFPFGTPPDKYIVTLSRREILHIPTSGNLEGDLWSSVFLSNHHRGDNPWPRNPYFPSIFRKGKVEMPHESYQECMDLDEAVKAIGFCLFLPDSRPESKETHANRHPIQLLLPPEKLTLYQRISTGGAGSGSKSTLRTGCHKHQREIRASLSYLATFPAGIHMRPVPTGPCSCKT